MKPAVYILSLVVASAGIIGLQAGMHEAAVIFLFWLTIVLSTFSGGWPASDKEKRGGLLVASLAAAYLIHTVLTEEGKSDVLSPIRVWWFIWPVWSLVMIHSAIRIRRFYEKKG